MSRLNEHVARRSYRLLTQCPRPRARACVRVCPQVARQTAETRDQLTAARDAWTPTVATLAAGWVEHCQQQETALHTRREAADAAHRSAETRRRQLAETTSETVQTGRQQLGKQQQRAEEQLGQRR